MMPLLVRAMTEADWPAVAAIYQAGIDTGHATFEAHPPASWDDFRSHKIDGCSLVALGGEGAVAGWAALSPVSDRCVYAGVAEVSVYVDPAARAKGVGDALLDALIARSEAEGIWTLQAGVFPENESSVRLHLKHGFRLVGVRERIGLMSFGPRAGQWRDALFLERRSRVAGV